jgi:hypothetical protein
MGGGGQGDRGRHKHACEEATASSETCTRRPRGRRSLPCDHAREASDHGEAMAQKRILEARRKKRDQRSSLAFRVGVEGSDGD